MTERGVNFVSMAAVMKSPMERKKKIPWKLEKVGSTVTGVQIQQVISNKIKTP